MKFSRKAPTQCNFSTLSDIVSIYRIQIPRMTSGPRWRDTCSSHLVEICVLYSVRCSQLKMGEIFETDLVSMRKISVSISEDCLYLNIYTPVDATRKSSLPVRLGSIGIKLMGSSIRIVHYLSDSDEGILEQMQHEPRQILCSVDSFHHRKYKFHEPSFLNYLEPLVVDY